MSNDLWMNRQLRKQVQQVASKHCASMEAGTNNCLISGKPCVYFRELLEGQQTDRCTWMEDAVLANEPEVEAEYQKRLFEYLNPGEISKQTKTSCAKCGKPVLMKGPNQKYCDGCKSDARKSATRERNRLYRQRKQGTV